MDNAYSERDQYYMIVSCNRCDIMLIRDLQISDENIYGKNKGERDCANLLHITYMLVV